MSALLVSGLPGAGKSEFCAWLAQEHGFVHIETDADVVINALAANDLQEVRAAAMKLKETAPKVALEWGFRRFFFRMGEWLSTPDLIRGGSAAAMRQRGEATGDASVEITARCVPSKLN